MPTQRGTQSDEDLVDGLTDQIENQLEEIRHYQRQASLFLRVIIGTASLLLPGILLAAETGVLENIIELWQSVDWQGLSSDLSRSVPLFDKYLGNLMIMIIISSSIFYIVQSIRYILIHIPRYSKQILKPSPSIMGLEFPNEIDPTSIQKETNESIEFEERYFEAVEKNQNVLSDTKGLFGDMLSSATDGIRSLLIAGLGLTIILIDTPLLIPLFFIFIMLSVAGDLHATFNQSEKLSDYVYFDRIIDTAFFGQFILIPIGLRYSFFEEYSVLLSLVYFTIFMVLLMMPAYYGFKSDLDKSSDNLIRITGIWIIIFFFSTISLAADPNIIYYRLPTKMTLWALMSYTFIFTTFGVGVIVRLLTHLVMNVYRYIMKNVHYLIKNYRN